MPFCILSTRCNSLCITCNRLHRVCLNIQTKNIKEIIKAFQTHAVDTTGAGDSFWGGVLCSILSINKPVEKMEWEEIRKCAVLGNAVAGLCVQKRGGIPAIPTKEAALEFMQK